MRADETDPATLDDADFARLVRVTPSDDLARMMRGDRRLAVLEVLFDRMISVFRADRAGSTEAVIHWRVGGRADGGFDTYEMAVSGGRCTRSLSGDRVPTLTLTLSAVDFLNLTTGNAHPVLLVMRGRLRTKGDVVLTAKFPTLFDIPKFA